MERVWRDSPASFAGEHYRFDDVWLEPKAWRADGPRLWLGGETVHPRLLQRIVRYAHGFHPLGQPSDEDLRLLGEGMAEAGRELADLELVGGMRPVFPDHASPSPLEPAIASIPAMWARGFRTFCIKPNQYLDDRSRLSRLVSRGCLAGRCARARGRCMSGQPTWAAEITVEQLDADPYPLYARMRREAPVCFVPAVGLWLVTRWDDVEFSTSHPELFDSAVSPSPLDRTMGGPSILVVDGEPQKKLRAMLEPSLRPRVVEATTPELIEPLVAGLLDKLEGRGHAELMSEYFEPVSVLGLGRVLGIPHLDGDTLRRWFAGLAQGAINFEDDPEKWKVADATGAEIDEELAPVFEALWAKPDGSTISTMLQQAEGTLEERVAQVLPTLKVILLGGMQEPGHGAGTTVAGLLLSGQADLVGRDPAGLTSAAVEEGLRWVSPIGTQTRRACAEIELGGATLPGGASLGVLVSSANRDEAVWGPTADAFDLTRPRRNHAAFGFGSHFCSGHHFSRVQLRIAVQRLFERLPGIRLDPERPPVFTGWEFRAPRNLDVTWDT